MPTLKKIVIQDFRNIELQELSFSGNVNCISGPNGAGKTNLLDAIYYLSMSKSAFASTEKFNYRFGCRSFSLSGTYVMGDGIESRFSISVGEGGEKKIRRDDKPYTRIADHIGVLPVVMVSPSDISMVSESGDERRRFVNSVISQMDREYLSAVQQYLKLLGGRNRLLKEGTPDSQLLDIFDSRMAVHARNVYDTRRAFVEALNPVIKKYYSLISGGRESVSVEYKSDLEGKSLEELLAKNREKDLILHYTSCGVQRDDFLFLMDGYPIRKCGSQGQQKSFLVALKFAQYEIMKTSYGYPPILLLDDLFDKLDMGRVRNLLEMVSSDSFGQIFLSDTDKSRISDFLDTITSDRTYYDTSGGIFSPVI